MDSIERMRRLNDLTKELKQHGFADSSFEAIEQAKQIYGDDELSPVVKEGIIKNNTHDKITRSEQTMNDDDQIQFQRRLGQMSTQMEVLTTKMNEIIKALNDMDTRINALKTRPVEHERIVERFVERPAQKQEEHASAVSTPVHQESQAPQQEQKPASSNGDYENQRVGKFTSTDVAIDKMFYYGKK